MAARANTQTRVVASLDGNTGHVVDQQYNQITLPIFTSFCTRLRAAHPEVLIVGVVLDNWPLHTSPVVLAALAAHRLTPLFLPAYASWLDPIEKLWRWVRQTVTHLHPRAADLEPLRAESSGYLQEPPQTPAVVYSPSPRHKCSLAPTRVP